MHNALHLLRTRRFLQVRGEDGVDLRLEVTERGRAWIALPPGRRLRSVADMYRREEMVPPGAAESAGLEELELDDLDSLDDIDMDDEDFDDDYDSFIYDNYDSGTIPLLAFDVSHRNTRAILEAAAVTALVGAGDEFLPLHAFSAYHSEQHNPLLQQPKTLAGWINGSVVSSMTAEEQEAFWEAALRGVVVLRLVPLGGAVMGTADDGAACFRISRVGRFILGLEGEFGESDVPGLVAATETPGVIVQPNFDVVFMAPAAAAEAELGRIAVRTGSAPVGTLFRITRDSIFAAAASGLDAESTLELLQRLSSQSLPPNVEREISGWFAACRRARGGDAYLLRFPDEESATRAQGIAGTMAQRIGPTVLEVVNRARRSVLSRKLRKHGIFVDEEPVRTRSRRR